jgi:hypothetical protein
MLPTTIFSQLIQTSASPLWLTFIVIKTSDLLAIVCAENLMTTCPSEESSLTDGTYSEKKKSLTKAQAN